MAPVADASSESLHSFVVDNVEPGATVITDAWQGYRWLEKNGYIRRRHLAAHRLL
jgi:transposase-like protein